MQGVFRVRAKRMQEPSIQPVAAWRPLLRLFACMIPSDEPGPVICGGRDEPTAGHNPHEVVLRRALMLHSLSELAIQRLLLCSRLFCVQPDETVFSAGDHEDVLYVIVEGKVKITRERGDDGASWMRIVGPTEAFGELTLFDPQPHAETARALTDCTLVAVAGADLRRWIFTHPEAAVSLLQVFGRRLRRATLEVSDAIFVDVGGRLAKQLISLGRQFGHYEGGRLQVFHDLSQADLAALVGSSRETVNKELGEFVERRWIDLGVRSFTILAPDHLAARFKVAGSAHTRWKRKPPKR